MSNGNNNVNERYSDRHIINVPPILWVSILAIVSIFTMLYLTSDTFRYFASDVYRSMRTAELICPIEKGIYAATGLGVSVFYPCLTQDVTTIYFSDLVKETFFANIFLLSIAGFVVYRMLKRLKSDHPAALFDEALTPDTAERMMEKHYPHITYFRRLDLVKDDIRTGEIPSAMSVKDFILKNGLIESYERRGDGIEVHLNKSKANSILEAQLGQSKIDFFKKYDKSKRASLALFKDEHTKQSPQLQQEFDESIIELGKKGVLELFLMALAAPKVYCLDETITKEQELEAMADYEQLANEFWHHFISATDTKDSRWYQKPLNHANVAFDYMEKYGKSIEVTSVFDQHAFISTCLMKLYDKANIAPADVGWLRAYNRRVWYIIQNKGRPTALIENAGTACHFSAEKAHGGELTEPEMSNAISAMREVCNRTIFTAEELK